MTRSELIDVLATEFPGLTQKDLRRTVESIFGAISFALENGDRVEIRGFGSFQSKRYDARKGRNPRTGKTVEVQATRRVRFKAGKRLQRKINTKPSARLT